VLQEASRISLMIARTIQRWWNCLGDWRRWYIQILFPSKMSKEVFFPRLNIASRNEYVQRV